MKSSIKKLVNWDKFKKRYPSAALRYVYSENGKLINDGLVLGNLIKEVNNEI